MMAELNKGNYRSGGDCGYEDSNRIFGKLSRYVK